MENSEEALMENSEKIVFDGTNCAKLDEVMSSQMRGVQRSSRISSNGPGCEQRVQISGGDIDNGSISKAHKIKHVLQPQKTRFKRQVFWSNAHEGNDPTEGPTCVHNDTDRGNWIKQEAAGDSGTVECVTGRERVPHLKVEETQESSRGETWTCAGGREMREEGKVTVN